MFDELFAQLTKPCPQYVRHMDYLAEAVAMRGRYRRNRMAWQPHLEGTRGAILSAAAKCRNRSKVVVLGAGLLLDVPIEELSSMFKEVVLLDIVFLPEAQRRIKQYCNARLVQHDVTNSAQTLYENVQQGLDELPSAAPRVPEIDGNTGLVVSLNILSQLWVVPRAYALRKLAGLEEDRVEEWCRQIVASHYDFLRALPCDTSLVADREFVKKDREGRIVGKKSTIFGLALPEPDISWTWNIMPPGVRHQYFSKELNVGVWQVVLQDSGRQIGQ